VPYLEADRNQFMHFRP